jgi:hypothetical protein
MDLPYFSLSTHFFDGHLGCFHLLIMMNNAEDEDALAFSF